MRFLIFISLLFLVVTAQAQHDTLVSGKTFHWVKYDLNRRAMEIGEDFSGNIHRGEWFFFDHNGLLTQHCYYRNDTMQGWTELYTNSEKKATRKFAGMTLRGNRTGTWTNYERHGFRWKAVGSTSYDASGHAVLKTLFYPNGNRMSETYFDENEKTIWYRFYTRKGKMFWEGDQPGDVLI